MSEPEQEEKLGWLRTVLYTWLFRPHINIPDDLAMVSRKIKAYGPEGYHKIVSSLEWAKVNPSYPFASLLPQDDASDAEIYDFFRRFLTAARCSMPRSPVVVDPAWITSAVRRLAEAIYEERAFDRMPVLGDALEEAGCVIQDVLGHCRQPGEHARGCWLLDRILGKE